MSNAQLLLVVLVISILSLSGCAEIPGLSGLFGPAEVTQYEHDIIVIRDVQATPTPNVKSGQSVNLHVYIKNVQRVGESTKKATVTLYDTCGIFQDIKIQGCDKKIGGELKCEMQMYPQSENELIWTMRGSDLSVEQTCNVGVQVEYKHKTPTISSVEFASKTEVENLIQQGQGKVTTGKMTVGEGPVKLYMQVAGQPILLERDSDNKIIGNGIIEFWVENKGSGSVVNREVDGYYIKAMSSTLAKIEFETSNHTKVGSEIKTGFNVKPPTKLIRGKTPVMNWILIPKPLNNNAIDQKVSFTMQLEGEVEYSYKFTKTIPMTVQPLL